MVFIAFILLALITYYALRFRSIKRIIFIHKINMNLILLVHKIKK